MPEIGRLEVEQMRWRVLLDGVPLSQAWVTYEHMNGQCLALRALGKERPRVQLETRRVEVVCDPASMSASCSLCGSSTSLQVAGLSFATHDIVGFELDGMNRPTLVPSAADTTNYGDWSDEAVWCVSCDALMKLPKGGVEW